MHLAFSTNAFTRISLPEALEKIRSLGYEGAELMADRPHLWPGDVTDEALTRIRARAESLDLTLCNINAFMMKAVRDIHHPSWIEENEEERAQRRDHTIASLHLARKLGVPCISTEPGGPLEGMDRARAESLFAEGLAAAAPEAEALGVRLLVEPEPDLLFEGMEETVAFLDRCALPSVGINFDVGHFFCIGKDPAALIRAHAGYLEHVHIEDIDASRRHHHLIPGTGAMDFGSLFEALHEVGYKGFVTVELYPFEDEPEAAAEAAYNYLLPYFKG